MLNFGGRFFLSVETVFFIKVDEKHADEYYISIVDVFFLKKHEKEHFYSG